MGRIWDSDARCERWGRVDWDCEWPSPEATDSVSWSRESQNLFHAGPSESEVDIVFIYKELVQLLRKGDG